ncbi:hypothetical protein N7471_012703 [Penicillium samsonianum]|uniref:uncharacterized protein n=1 Tax=Penicillium samsonianum TaxID=1882272 RepID=UPI0025470BB0|nr:uncharacterized protein N7471_012703 [Penicillium samsonianum]KAJ6125386.1 hypothetical protein N7471_012703 [Penicillium samsonianum]
MLNELSLEDKLISIIGDNASNNEAMASELYFSLSDRPRINRSPQRRQKWKEICRLNNLPDKFVAYDVTTRWNSTFRMVDDGLKSRQQVNKFLNLQEELPPFTLQDWSRLEQIHAVLHKFNELTLFISKRNPDLNTPHLFYPELQSNYDEVTDSFDSMDLKPDLLRGIHFCGFKRPSAI